MRSRKRPLLLLLIGMLSFIAFICVIYFLPPKTTLSLPEEFSTLPFSLEKVIQLPTLILFFVLLGMFLFSIGAYLFKNKAHGVLIAGLVIIYLLLRLNHLTHPFFLILLLALFFVLELFISNRDNSKI